MFDHHHPNLDYDPLESKTIKTYRFLWSFIKPYWKTALLGIISIFISTYILLTLGSTLKTIIDGGLVTLDQKSLDKFLVVLLLAVFILSLSSYGRSYFISYLGEKIVADIRDLTFRHLLTLNIAFYESNRSGDIISRLTTDMQLIQIAISNSVPLASRNLLLVLGGLVMMFLTSLKLSLFTLCIVPLVISPLVIVGKRLRGQSKKVQAHLARASGFLDEIFHGIRTVYAFNHQKEDITKFDHYNSVILDGAKRRIHIRSFLAFLIMLLVFVGIGIVLWIGGRLVLAGEISSGNLASFIFYAVILAAGAGTFSEMFSDIQRAVGACERVIELLQYPSSDCMADGQTRSLPKPARGILAIHNINFAYPAMPDKIILENFTISVAPGEKLAIVGHSGSGKSSIFSILLRFFDPQSGSIFLDGINYKDLSVHDIRERVSIVPQDPMIFTGSIYDNIKFGKPDASDSDIWKAAEAAKLADVIASFSDGLFTRVGNRGVSLSAGQKQRVAIARAILRDPAVLLLDEATSGLDAESEYAVEQSLKQLMATRTTIVIAHRLSTILQADRIVVIENSRIEAVGSHAELIIQDGLYRRLATIQFESIMSGH